MAPKFGLRMNWKKQQRSNLSDTDPSNIGTSLNWKSSKDILNIYNWVWLWVWLGHAVVFLTDLSHLWVPRCPDKRGKDVLWIYLFRVWKV